MTKEHILIITEGNKTEPQFLKNIEEVFFKNLGKEIIFLSFCTNIYKLYNKLKKDRDMLDTFEVLKDICSDSSEQVRSINSSSLELLEELDADDISQIYLFFDYDPQDHSQDNNHILEMIELFSEETENGRV